MGLGSDFLGLWPGLQRLVCGIRSEPEVPTEALCLKELRQSQHRADETKTALMQLEEASAIWSPGGVAQRLGVRALKVMGLPRALKGRRGVFSR